MTLVISFVKRVIFYDWCVSKNNLHELVVVNVVRLLQKEREKRGLSMNIVAQRSGLSQSIVSLIERDLRNPTLETLLRIADTLEISLGDILNQAKMEVSQAASSAKKTSQK